MAKESANRLVLTQFMAVVLPVTLVLLTQTVLDGRRAAAMEQSRPLRVMAQEARASYKGFMAGVVDAVDTGSLSASSAGQLQAAAGKLAELSKAGADPAVLKAAPTDLAALSKEVGNGGDLSLLMKIRDRVRAGDESTKAIAEEFDARDAAVMQSAMRSAHMQRYAVTIAIILSVILTVWFVRSSQRRLAARRAADEQAAHEALRLRNALDNCPVGIMVADPAGNVMYANRSVGRQLGLALPAVRARGGGSPEGMALTDIVGSDAARLREGVRMDLTLGGRVFRFNSEVVRAADGHPVGVVVECSDQTDQVALEREVATIVEAAAGGEFSRRIPQMDQGVAGGFYGPLISGINKLMETSEGSLDDVASMLEALANGNLTRRITRDYRGTFAKLKDYSNRTADRLEEIVGQIKGVAVAIDGAARSIAEGSSDLSTRTEQQADGAQHTARSMAEITSLVRDNNSRAHEGDRLAGDAARVARDGGEIVTRIIQTMSDISAASRKISDIIGVIDSLAFQTNILALNAAVEAARAGDHGRGFAVVAAEVRSLAGRSAEAAHEIRGLIGTSVKTVDAGAKLVTSAGDSMTEIVAAIGRVSAIVREIAEASATQTTGVESVDRSIAQIDSATRQNMQRVQEAAESAQALAEQATFLVQAVAVFKLQEEARRGVSAAGGRGVVRAVG